jgi:biotin synthase
MDMGACDADCSFCWYGASHTQVQPSRLDLDEIVMRCKQFAAGGATGVYLITMHRSPFDWYLNLCAKTRQAIDTDLELFANIGDISLSQCNELRAAGITGAYHSCRLREGVDTRLRPAERRKTMDNLLAAGINLHTLCEPIGPEHTPEELAEQLWLGVELPCALHGVLQRFPVPGSRLFDKGQVSMARLSQILAVIALATIGKQETKYLSIMLSSYVGLFSGANVIYAEAGDSDTCCASPDTDRGFTSAMWRQSNDNKITTADCRNMLRTAGFTQTMDAQNGPNQPLHATACSRA